MSNQTYVNNRKKVQFANALPFGKLVGQKSTSISVVANGTNSISFDHGQKSIPSILGWARFQNDGRWIAAGNSIGFTSTEFGGFNRVAVKPFTTETTYGVLVRNLDTSNAYTIDLKLWLFIV